MIVFAVERFEAVREEIRPLWRDHYAEAAADREAIPFDMDEGTYAALDTADRLILVTARRALELVGYATAIVGTHMHCRTQVQAVGDLHYLAPACRGPGVAERLFGALEVEARARGVTRLMIPTPTRKGYQGRLLTALGFRSLETVYSKVIA